MKFVTGEITADRNTFRMIIAVKQLLSSQMFWRKKWINLHDLMIDMMVNETTEKL